MSSRGLATAICVIGLSISGAAECVLETPDAQYPSERASEGCVGTPVYRVGMGRREVAQAARPVAQALRSLKLPLRRSVIAARPGRVSAPAILPVRGIECGVLRGTLPARFFCGLPVRIRLGASAPAPPPQIHCAEPGSDEQQRRRFGYRGAVIELVADTVGVDPLDPW
jgi:hypothetical protein